MSGLTEATAFREKHNDLNGVVLRGQVIANNDPLRMQRIKILVPDVYEDGVDNTPWAIPAVGNGANNQDQQVDVPALDSLVYVILQQGDPHYPMWYGAAHTTANSALGALASNYPNRVGRIYPDGTYVYFDRTTHDFVVHHGTGTEFHILGDGTVASNASVWNHTGNVNLTGNLTVAGNINATGIVVGDVDVRSGPISLRMHRHDGVRNGPNFTSTAVV